MSVRTLHACEVRRFDTVSLDPDYSGRVCGEPAKLHPICGRSYWMCDACAAIGWAPPVCTGCGQPADNLDDHLDCFAPKPVS